jgi:hypothetical protein
MAWKLVVALLVVLLGREKKRGKLENELEKQMEHELANGARKAWDEYRKLPWNDRV